MEKNFCQRCSKELKPGTEVWLYFRTSTGTYHPQNETAGWMDTVDNQGAFPFGKDCAERELELTMKLMVIEERKNR